MQGVSPRWGLRWFLPAGVAGAARSYSLAGPVPPEQGLGRALRATLRADQQQVGAGEYRTC